MNSNWDTFSREERKRSEQQHWSRETAHDLLSFSIPLYKSIRIPQTVDSSPICRETSPLMRFPDLSGSRSPQPQDMDHLFSSRSLRSQPNGKSRSTTRNGSVLMHHNLYRLTFPVLSASKQRRTHSQSSAKNYSVTEKRCFGTLLFLAFKYLMTAPSAEMTVTSLSTRKNTKIGIVFVSPLLGIKFLYLVADADSTPRIQLLANTSYIGCC